LVPNLSFEIKVLVPNLSYLIGGLNIKKCADPRPQDIQPANVLKIAAYSIALARQPSIRDWRLSVLEPAVRIGNKRPMNHLHNPAKST
jgi:hypothetical protein